MSVAAPCDRISRLSELRLDRPSFSPKPDTVWQDRTRRGPGAKVAGIALAMALMGGGFMAGQRFNAATPMQTPAAAQPAPPAASSTTGSYVSASGYVVARRVTTLAAQITGQISDIVVTEGDRVEAGQLIARLKSDAAQANLENAFASASAQSASVRALGAEYQQALRTRDRFRRLADRGFARRADADASDAQVAALAARVDQARAEQSASIATSQSARVALSNHEIRAPFGGIVTSVNAQPGEIISPISAGGGFTRTGICTIMDMTNLEIEADVNESYMPRVAAGQPVRITLDAYPSRRIKGSVLAVVPTADRARGTFRVRIAISEHDGLALPNMAAKVSIMTGPTDRASNSSLREGLES